MGAYKAKAKDCRRDERQLRATERGGKVVEREGRKEMELRQSFGWCRMPGSAGKCQKRKKSVETLVRGMTKGVTRPRMERVGGWCTRV